MNTEFEGAMATDVEVTDKDCKEDAGSLSEVDFVAGAGGWIGALLELFGLLTVLPLTN